MLVSAVEFTAIMVSTMISGIASAPRYHSIPNQAVHIHTPMAPTIGTPTIEIQIGSSMCLSTSFRGARSLENIPRNADTMICGLANRPTSEATTMIEMPHQSAHVFSTQV